MTEPHSASALSQRYGHLLIQDTVRIEPGRGGLPHLLIQHAGALAEIYFHGAHVAQYVPPHAQPTLFLSTASYFGPGKPIRGGVPLIFPWFGPHPANPALPAHGFARTSEWTLVAVRKHTNRLTVEMSLKDSPETHALWPHAFELRFIVRIGANLELALAVYNRDKTPFTFEEAMHTYLAIGDIRRLKIQGLAGRDYLDKMQAGRRMHQDERPIIINGETDRVYLGTRDVVKVAETCGRELTVAKTGSNATVVWNPWIAKARALPDFGDDEWTHMLCIETANAAEHAIVLAPGEHHTMTATITAGHSRQLLGM